MHGWHLLRRLIHRLGAPSGRIATRSGGAGRALVGRPVRTAAAPESQGRGRTATVRPAVGRPVRTAATPESQGRGRTATVRPAAPESQGRGRTATVRPAVGRPVRPAAAPESQGRGRTATVRPAVGRPVRTAAAPESQRRGRTATVLSTAQESRPGSGATPGSSGRVGAVWPAGGPARCGKVREGRRANFEAGPPSLGRRLRAARG